MDTKKQLLQLKPEDYPLYNKFYVLTKSKFVNLVNKLKPSIVNYIPSQMKYKKSIEKYNGVYFLIKEDWENNEELNNVTDYFSEIVRIQCRFKDSISPFDYWCQYHNDITNMSIKRYGEINIKFIRDIMYENVKFCNNFRISVALTIFKLFKAKKVLDPSAGWQDRLIGAIAHNVEKYVGVDPNEKLRPCYDKILETLIEPDKRKNYVLITDGFEMADIPKDDYDLVFTSPPFFDLENYSDSIKDSVNAYKTIDSWYNNFLLVLLKKSYDNLIIGGHLVLYIAESSNVRYIDKMLKYMNNLMHYNGCIYYYYETTFVPRKIYVWKKN